MLGKLIGKMLKIDIKKVTAAEAHLALVSSYFNMNAFDFPQDGSNVTRRLHSSDQSQWIHYDRLNK